MRLIQLDYHTVVSEISCAQSDSEHDIPIPGRCLISMTVGLREFLLAKSRSHCFNCVRTAASCSTSSVREAVGVLVERIVEDMAQCTAGVG
jgi:uncharacterized protein with PIN domain